MIRWCCISTLFLSLIYCLCFMFSVWVGGVIIFSRHQTRETTRSGTKKRARRCPRACLQPWTVVEIPFLYTIHTGDTWVGGTRRCLTSVQSALRKALIGWVVQPMAWAISGQQPIELSLDSGTWIHARVDARKVAEIEGGWGERELTQAIDEQPGRWAEGWAPRDAPPATKSVVTGLWK